MIERRIVSSDKRVETVGHSSKGNQLKWHIDNDWYKADYMGYEGLAEVLISSLLEKSNVPAYVDYLPTSIIYNEKEYHGCKSENFLQADEELITVEKLYRQYTGKGLTNELARIPDIKDRIGYMVENVIEITGLQDFGKYLAMELELDAFFLNEDRHTNNIAVIRSVESGKFRLCPYFDHGLALFSDTTYDFGLEKTIDECMEKIEAKPFCRDFDEQMDAAEELYGVPLHLGFTTHDVVEELRKFEGIYDAEILKRVEEVLRNQIRKYQYLISK